MHVGAIVLADPYSLCVSGSRHLPSHSTGWLNAPSVRLLKFYEIEGGEGGEGGCHARSLRSQPCTALRSRLVHPCVNSNLQQSELRQYIYNKEEGLEPSGSYR